MGFLGLEAKSQEEEPVNTTRTVDMEWLVVAKVQYSKYHSSKQTFARVLEAPQLCVIIVLLFFCPFPFSFVEYLPMLTTGLNTIASNLCAIESESTGKRKKKTCTGRLILFLRWEKKKKKQFDSVATPFRLSWSVMSGGLFPSLVNGMARTTTTTVRRVH